MSSSMDPDLCRLLLGGREGISASPRQDLACPPASPMARQPAACGRARAGPDIAPARPWQHLPAGGGARQRPPHAGAGGVQVVGQVALQLPQGEVWPRTRHHRCCGERGGSGGGPSIGPCPAGRGAPTCSRDGGAVGTLPCPSSWGGAVASWWHSLRDTWMSSVTLNTPEVTKLSWKSVESVRERGGSAEGGTG